MTAGHWSEITWPAIVSTVPAPIWRRPRPLHRSAHRGVARAGVTRF